MHGRFTSDMSLLYSHLNLFTKPQEAASIDKSNTVAEMTIMSVLQYRFENFVTVDVTLSLFL